eukprot:TsM_001021900 transcript=TsM_001021900 gene=TsM_001021900
MRIWVRPATKITSPPSDFQGPTRANRTPQEGWCFTEVIPLSPDNPIPGVVTVLTKKRKLFPELLPTSPSSFASPRLMVPAHQPTSRWTASRPATDTTHLREQGREY